MSIESKSNIKLLSLQHPKTRCPRCGKAEMVLDADSGEQVCTNCGYVLKEKIEEEGPEWRNFSKEQGDEDRSRAGLPSSLAIHDMGLATIIGDQNRDYSGRSLGAAMKASIERLRTWDKRSQIHESADRNMRQAFGELNRMAE